MKMTKFFCALLALLTGCCSLTANQWIKTYALDPYIGPEIYYVNREKEGGAKQGGTLYGVRIGYDRVKRYKFYWGIDGLWAKGVLEGHRKREALQGETLKDHLKSDFTDINVEARLGYTFQSKSWRCASLTPFGGLGYFWEKNHYKHHSPLHVQFKNNFTYIVGGFLSQVFILPTWSAGFNFKVRYLLEAEQKVEGDPEYGNLTQHYEERLQYRAEVPVTHFYCWGGCPLAVSLVPFFEYRAYGHRANFPFDFLEVKLKLYGATLKFHYLF
jgi:hypothetical protein